MAISVGPTHEREKNTLSSLDFPSYYVATQLSGKNLLTGFIIDKIDKGSLFLENTTLKLISQHLQ